MNREQLSTNVGNILRMFRHYGYFDTSLINKGRLLEIFDKQSLQNRGKNFSRQIVQEVWGQSETMSNSEATVLTFSKIFAEAIVILKQRINKIEGESGLKKKEDEIEKRKRELKELEYQYEKGYEQSYEQINNARKNITFLETKLNQLKQTREGFKDELKQIEECLFVKEEQNHLQQTEVIHRDLDQSISAYQPSQSPNLSHIFVVTVICLLLELFVLTYRKSLLPLLCYSLIIHFLFLGYYNAQFVKYVLGAVIISCLFDLFSLCLIVIGKLSWSSLRHSSTQIIFITSAVLILVELVLRVYLLIKLYPYREPGERRQYFNLFGVEINLNRRSGKTQE